jgi:hypothetical protein
MSRSAPWLFAIAALAGAFAAAAPAVGADAYLRAVEPRAVVVEEVPPPVEPVPEPVAPAAVPGPLLPEPQVQFGCKRIWRCDTTVCEWRRGCWGVYGYVEGPYFTSVFARRQWEAHGLGDPEPRRRRRTHK